MSSSDPPESRSRSQSTEQAGTSGLRTVAAARYVVPFREGGSLPALIETDDEELFVVKFRGAGQGLRALIAEIIGGELARSLGLAVPELVLVELQSDLARTERDQEIAELIDQSAGRNVGIGYLSGSLMFDPAAVDTVDPKLASLIVLLDSFIMNVDRSARNPNLLWFERELWLIDHGAALYWHHDWDGSIETADRAFPLVSAHVLLPWADALDEAEVAIAGLDDATIEAVLQRVPDEFLAESGTAPEVRRRAYVDFFRARRDARAFFVGEAKHARARV